MNRILLTTLLCFLCASLSDIQAQNRFAPFKLSDSEKRTVPELSVLQETDLYQVLDLNVETMSKLVESTPTALELRIPINENDELIMDLEQIDIFTEDFKIILASKNTQSEYEHGIHYVGKLQNDISSLVSISIYKNEIAGFISTEDKNLSLGKLVGRDWTMEHVIYDDAFVFQNKQLDCETRSDGKSYNGRDLELTSVEDLTEKCVELYFEVDHDIYTHFGNLNGTLNFITGLISQVIALYQNESINTQISEIKVWDIPSPYSGNSSSAMLNSFKANTGSFYGDLAQLLSFKASGGKAAGFSGLCNSNPDESKSFSSISSSYSNIPNYSWSVHVVTHEFGHLFGSRHTHACVWNGNGTAIDGCAGGTEGNCATPGYPSPAGTIMSYCHFSGRPGISFSLGFGGQPGNIIRSNVINSACASQCCPYVPDWCNADQFTSHFQVLGDGSGVHTYPTLKGDFNGDGKMDIVFIGQGWIGTGLNIRTKLSNGNGTYSSHYQVLGDGAGVHANPALTGDFNGDGKTDIVFIGQGWNGAGLNIRTKLSNGNGTYSSHYQVLGDGAGVHTHRALTGDFNGDGKTDIVFVGQGWNGTGLNIRTKLSNGNGTYSSHYQVLGDGAGVHTHPALTGDFNGDGKTDIVFVGQGWNGTGLNIRTKLSNGNGTYSSHYQVLGDGAGVHTHPALTGDFNGDGKSDIVFVGQGWNGVGLNIRTKLSSGNGTYSSHHQVLGDGAGVHTYPALTGDFNGDGKTDIAFVGQNWTGCKNGLNVRIKLSEGNSWNSDCQIIGDGSGVHTYPALCGDFSGDNKSDIVFIGQNWNGQGLNIRTKTSN